MEYSLNSRVSPRFLIKADEIKVDFRDRATIPDLIQKYLNKRILLLPGTEPFDWEEIRRYNMMCHQNFVLCVNSLNDARTAKELEIKFMLSMEATSYWELEGLEELGAEYAYVGIPLFFDLPHSLDFEIKLRAVPTVSYNHILPRENGIFGQWIRPEDVDEYEPFIQVLEFEPCLVKREETLFKVYAEDKKWNTRLDILVEDLGSDAINRLIDPTLVEKRIACRQRCKNGGSCRLCETVLKLANPNLITRHIEK